MCQTRVSLEVCLAGRAATWVRIPPPPPGFRQRRIRGFEPEPPPTKRRNSATSGARQAETRPGGRWGGPPKPHRPNPAPPPRGRRICFPPLGRGAQGARRRADRVDRDGAGHQSPAGGIMAYEALSRKWRPKTFGEIVGQGHVTRSLANAISLGKIHHAYLFAGTRGGGKTTL